MAVARALFERPPTDSELAAFGFRRQDYQHECVTYWPDTSQAIELFVLMRTQWRSGFNGPTGLDYCALYPLMERLDLAAETWDALLLDIRGMEAEALTAMHEKED